MQTDWKGIEATPEFQELVHRRRAFVVPCTIFFLSYYMLFVALAGYAPDFMGRSLYEGLTVGYGLALTQFVMVWVLGAMYLRKSKRDLDPLRAASLRAADAGTSTTSGGSLSGVARDSDRDLDRAPDGKLVGEPSTTRPEVQR